MNSPVRFAVPATVAVKVRANIRQGAPSIHAPIKERVDSRTDLVVVGLCTGDKVGQEDHWWMLEGNTFIWAGSCSKVIMPSGTTPVDQPQGSPIIPKLPYPVVDMMQPATPHLQALKDRGVHTIGRYYSLNLDKRLSLHEAQAIAQAGLDVFVVYEDGSQPDDFDAIAGTRHAKLALECAKDIGQPSGTVIYFAADFEANQAHITHRLEPYFEAIGYVMRAAGNPYRIGVYSDGLACQALLTQGLAHVAWLSMSTGFPGSKAFYASRKWALTQHKTVSIGSGKDQFEVDTNEPNGNFGSFRLAAAIADHTNDPPWMVWMRENLGKVQLTGSRPTDFTEMIFSHTEFGPLNGRTPPSCAATVCAALELTGYRSTRNAAAFSYASYGTPCLLKPGCIVVYEWPSGDHHVDFCDEIIVDSDWIKGLGGNQSSTLRDSVYPRKYIIATRWPVR